MLSQDNQQVNIGDWVWVHGFENKDTWYKPIRKQLKPTYRLFWKDFQRCVEYCKLLNVK